MRDWLHRHPFAVLGAGWTAFMAVAAAVTTHYVDGSVVPYIWVATVAITFRLGVSLTVWAVESGLEDQEDQDA